MGDFTVMTEVAAVVPELLGDALARCLMRSHDFAEAPIDSKDVQGQRDAEFQQKMNELGATWQSRLSTIGEKA
jgi:hypothetical protein